MEFKFNYGDKVRTPNGSVGTVVGPLIDRPPSLINEENAEYVIEINDRTCIYPGYKLVLVEEER